MENGIGLDVIKYAGANENLFAFKWYNPWTKTQDLKCYTLLWRKYFKKQRSIYIPFVYCGVYQVVHNEEFKI